MPEQAHTWGAVSRLAGALLPLMAPPKGLSGSGSMPASNSRAALRSRLPAAAARGECTASAARAALLRERCMGAASARSSMESSRLTDATETFRAPFRKARREGSAARSAAAAGAAAAVAAAAAAAQVGLRGRRGSAAAFWGAGEAAAGCLRAATAREAVLAVWLASARGVLAMAVGLGKGWTEVW